MQNNTGGATTPNNWSFSFDLGDVKAIGEGTYKVAPEGYYKATIVQSLMNSMEQRVGFAVEISEGEFKGCRCEKGIKLPSVAKNGFVWASLFQSLGYPDDMARQKGFSPNPAEWVNRPVFVYWRNGNKDTNTYRELLFMSQDAWEYKKAKAESVSKTTTQQTAQPAQSTPQASQLTAPTTALPQAPQASVNTIPQATVNNGSGFAGVNTSSLLSSLNNR